MDLTKLSFNQAAQMLVNANNKHEELLKLYLNGMEDNKELCDEMDYLEFQIKKLYKFLTK